MKSFTKIISCAAVAVVLVGAVGLTSCEKKGNGMLDPSAKVYISPAKAKASVGADQTGTQGAQSKANPKHLSNLEIVKQAGQLHPKEWRTGIGDWNRDTINERFIIGSTWAVGDRGQLTESFITARDMVFETWIPGIGVGDTIAYIPNATIIAAEKAIRSAYAAENYAECYRLMQEGFTFTPITGAEYRELEKQGKN